MLHKGLLLLGNNHLQSDKEIDINKSGFAIHWNFILTEGSNKNYITWYDTFAALPEDFGLDIDVARSYKCMQEFSLYFNTPPKFNTKYIEEEGVVLENDEAPLISLIPISEGNETNSPLELPAVDYTTIDYSHLDTFYLSSDKNGSKDKLETYILGHYDIDLRKNQSFAKMITELKETVSEITSV
mgnify:CR=1 FL=1